MFWFHSKTLRRQARLRGDTGWVASKLRHPFSAHTQALMVCLEMIFPFSIEICIQVPGLYWGVYVVETNVLEKTSASSFWMVYKCIV